MLNQSTELLADVGWSIGVGMVCESSAVLLASSDLLNVAQATFLLGILARPGTSTSCQLFVLVARSKVEVPHFSRGTINLKNSLKGFP